MSEDTTEAPHRLIALRGKYGMGRFAKVSPEDYEWAMGFTWRANASGYAIRSVVKTIHFMHRDLLAPRPGMVTDHINGDVLDNRRSNLRACTHADNMRNRRGNGTRQSQFKGVSPSKQVGRWQVTIGAHGQKHNCGTYDTEEEAARAYDAAAVHFFGEFARTNFADPQPLSPTELRAARPRRNRWDFRKQHA